MSQQSSTEQVAENVMALSCTQQSNLAMFVFIGWVKFNPNAPMTVPLIAKATSHIRRGCQFKAMSFAMAFMLFLE